MLTVVTAFVPSPTYRPEYVRVLQQQALRNGADNFVCLTDETIDGVRCIPRRHKWPGWWSKIEVLSLPFAGTVLFVDLDSLILRDISYLAKFPTPMFPRDSSYKDEPCSCFILFRENELRPLYDVFVSDPISAMDRTFAPNAPNRVYGDQVFMAEVMRRFNLGWAPLQDYDKGVLSFIWNYPAEEPKTAICTFGAEWKPWDKHPRLKRFGGWWRPIWERELALLGMAAHG